MTHREAVQVLPKQFGTNWGYDIVISDSGASVQDYLDALNQGSAFTIPAAARPKKINRA